MNYTRHLYGLVIAILLVTMSTVSGATWTEINNGFPVAGVGASVLAFDPAINDA